MRIEKKKPDCSHKFSHNFSVLKSKNIGRAHSFSLNFFVKNKTFSKKIEKTGDLF